MNVIAHRAGLVALLTAFGAFGGACTGDNPTACSGSACGSSGSTAGADFDLIAVGSGVVVQGATATLELTLVRTGFQGPVNVAITGLPGKVTASPLVIAGGQLTGSLSVTAEAAAAQGDVEITVVASDLEGKLRHEKKARLLVRGPSGSLDTTFGTGGKLVVAAGVGTSSLAGVQVQPDGKVVVGATAEKDFVALRFDASGAPDKAFANNGRVAADLRVEANPTDDAATGIALAPDGKIVVAGYTIVPTSKYALARVTPEGALDPSFNGVGFLFTDYAPNPEWLGNLIVDSVTVQPDGKPVIAGRILEMPGGTDRMVMARFKTNGALDDTFQSKGFTSGRVVAGSNDHCVSVAAAKDGKVVCAAITSSATYPTDRFAAFRVDAQGTPDPGFGAAGIANVGFAAAAIAGTVLPIPDGRVLVTGVVGGKFACARFTDAGQLDTSFAGTGKVVFDGITAIAAGASVGAVLDADGRAVVAGAGPDQELVIARVLPAGTPDPSFGSGGVVVSALGKKVGSVARVALAPDGRVVVATTVTNANPEIAVLRFWP